MKAFLLSFLTPRGRIGIGAYWWRQLVLALPLYPCSFFSAVAYMSMFRSGFIFELVMFLPLSLAQGNPLTLFSSFHGAGDASFAYSARWHMAMENHPCVPPLTGWQLLPGLLGLLCILLAILLGWCSFALLLRRLRDAGVSLWLLPCFLTACWVFWAVGTDAPAAVCCCALFLPLIASIFFSCLPTQLAKTHITDAEIPSTSPQP